VKGWFLRIDNNVLRQMLSSGVGGELMNELRALEKRGPMAVDVQTIMFEPAYWRLMPRVPPADRWELVVLLDRESGADVIYVVSVRPRRRSGDRSRRRG
jgi:hypothetical protein